MDSRLITSYGVEIANQASFALEGMMDRAAEKLGLDGYQIRERNLLKVGDKFSTGHLIDEGCGDALRAWFGGCGFVYAACALRISAATSGPPTNVIDFVFLGPTAFSRNVLTNHCALENALLRWLSCFKFDSI